jgi:hypothetical protein
MRRVFPILLTLLAAYPACGSDYPARVVGISDGDNITVLTRPARRTWSSVICSRSAWTSR